MADGNGPGHPLRFLQQVNLIDDRRCADVHFCVIRIHGQRDDVLIDVLHQGEYGSLSIRVRQGDCLFLLAVHIYAELRVFLIGIFDIDLFPAVRLFHEQLHAIEEPVVIRDMLEGKLQRIPSSSVMPVSAYMIL